MDDEKKSEVLAKALVRVIFWCIDTVIFVYLASRLGLDLSRWEWVLLYWLVCV